MARLKPYVDDYYLWDYVPSQILAVIFTSLFTTATALVTWKCIRSRTYFSIPFIIGGIFQIIGYISRAVALNQTDSLGLFLIQSITILVAPALAAASVYMVLGRLMRSVHGEKHSIVPVRWLTRAFVAGDLLAFNIQSTGGGFSGSDHISEDVARAVILGGLLVQVLLFGLFVATAAVFHVRLVKWPSAASKAEGATWRQTMGMLYAVSGLIMVRSVFRVIEYAMGKGGYLLQNEWTLYVFDAAVMFVTTVLYGWWHPGDLAPKPEGWETVDSAPGTATWTDLGVRGGDEGEMGK